jgi:hypothetical protein
VTVGDEGVGLRLDNAHQVAERDGGVEQVQRLWSPTGPAQVATPLSRRAERGTTSVRLNSDGRRVLAARNGHVSATVLLNNHPAGNIRLKR